MSPGQIEKSKHSIDKLSQQDMAHLYRFAPSGHPYFDNTNAEVSNYFSERFKHLGGMTTEISKLIGL